MTARDRLRTAGPRRVGRFAAFLAVTFLACGGGEPGALPDLEPGDLLFQIERSADAVRLQLREGSTYTSVAVVLTVGETPEETEVFATNDSVRIVDLASWREEGMGRFVAVRRVRESPVRDRLTADAWKTTARRLVTADVARSDGSHVVSLYRDVLGIELLPGANDAVIADDLQRSNLFADVP